MVWRQVVAGRQLSADPLDSATSAVEDRIQIQERSQILSSHSTLPSTTPPTAYKSGGVPRLFAPVGLARSWARLFIGLEGAPTRVLSISFCAVSESALSNKALELTGRGRRSAAIGRRRPRLGVGSSSVSIRLAAVARNRVISRPAGSSMPIRWAA